MSTAQPLASEGLTHWYKPDGSPAYTIIGRNGKERPTTVTDARKLGLLPSVTKIIRCAASFGLERWKAEQLLLAGLTLPRTEGEAEAEWIKRVWEDSQQQAIAAAERGTQIHAAIESHYRGDGFDPEWYRWVKTTVATIQFTFGEPQWSAEKSFATTTYGGKIDLHAPGLVLDIKTKDGSLSDVKLYDEHAMQLAAYAQGLKMDWRLTDLRAGIVFVSRTEPKAIVKELDAAELDRGWNMFQSLLSYWYAANRMEVA